MRSFTVFLFVLALYTLPASAVMAQTQVTPATALQERLSPEKAQMLALKAVPGQALQMTEKFADQDMYYSFMIGTPDGSIYEVPVHSASGELAEISVESLAKRPKDIPFEIVSMADARATVKAYVIENTPGKRPPFMKDGRMGVHERKLVYTFKPKRDGRWYTVIVDARSGAVVDLQGNAP